MEIIQEKGSVKMFVRHACYPHGTTHFHWHNRLEVLQPLSGDLELFIDGSWYTAKENDIVIIGERVIHAFRIPGKSCSMRLGWFPLSILLNTGVIPLPLKPLITAKELAALEHLPQLVNIIFDLIEKEPRVDNAGYNPLVQSLFASLYFSLMRHFSVTTDEKVTGKEKQDFFRIVEYVNTHFTEHLTVQSAAQALYMNRGKISGLFTKYAGMPLNTYISDLRLERANQLIQDGAGITQAALESGFQSVRTFNDIYKKANGTAPSKKDK